MRAPAGRPFGEMQRPELFPCSRGQKSAAASWTAVTEMHGASLHRRHRFLGVSSAVEGHHSIRPAQAAALSRGIECYVDPARRPACKSGVAPRLAARSPRRSALAWALGFLPRDSVLECSSPLELSVGQRTRESAGGPAH